MIDPEAGFYAHVSQDATLKTLLGTKASGRADIRHGWPGEVTELSDAMLTYFRPSGSQRPHIGEFTIQVDMWVPPDDGDTVALIDNRLLELCNEKQWRFETGRIWCVEAGSADYPAPTDKPMRRRRNFRLTVS